MDESNLPNWPRLLPELEPWLDRPLDELPDWLKIRLKTAGWPPVGDELALWEQLSPDQRKWRAENRDCENDPSMAESRERIWKLVTEHGRTRREIEKWEAVSAPTATDLEIKCAKLSELRKKIENLTSKLNDREPANTPPTKPHNARDIVISAAISEFQKDGIDTPGATALMAKLLSGQPIAGITIQRSSDTKGQPAAKIAGKLLTINALRKRLGKMKPSN